MPGSRRAGGLPVGAHRQAASSGGPSRGEQTDDFLERYRRRGGIEGTNSGVKRRTGLGRLRVRGQPRVFTEILLRLAGWNILRAAVCSTLRERVAERAHAALAAAFFIGFLAPIRHLALPPAIPQPIRLLSTLCPASSHARPLHAA